MLLLGIAAALTQTADWPQTRAERSNYTETSHYEDVVGFIQALELKGAPIRLEWMGVSAEGKKEPLVIASRPMMTAEQARRSGRPILYIQANIHAGEVEGKEAALALLRDWSKGPSVLDKAVVLMAPIYNIDGNEKFGPVAENRPEQDGPAMVGLRPNGQGFDLNRDCIKAESPEMQGVLAYVWKGWDPDVLFDLHTTDGTRHGFELTYSPSLNPNTNPAVMRYTRDELLPAVRKEMKAKYGVELFDYGNGEGRGATRAWRTFEPFGRYVTNYAGLRNRISILSEATTFIPFKARVLATYRFVQACVDHTMRNAKRVVAMTREADLWRPKELGVRFEMDKRGVEAVPLEKLAPGEARPLSGRPKAVEWVKMPIYDRFRITESASVPFAYGLPPSEEKLAALLVRHGIVVERLTQPVSGNALDFRVEKATQATRPFQGHRLLTLDGRYVWGPASLPVGSFFIRTDQPLGTLAFYMLEPRNVDSAIAWGGLSADPVAGSPLPIVKFSDPIAVESVVVDSP